MQAAGRRNIDVAYELSPKTAKPALPGEDYDGSSGTLTFGTNDTEKTIRIPIYQDEIDEEREKFVVTLTASGGAVVDPARDTAVVTIMDQYITNDPYVPQASVHSTMTAPSRRAPAARSSWSGWTGPPVRPWSWTGILFCSRAPPQSGPTTTISA